MQTQTQTQTAAATAQTQTVAAPAMPNALGQMARFAQTQAAAAAAQAARLAAATYVLVRPSKANLSRPATGGKTQAATNANYAAAVMLQVYPLIAASGLTPAQQAATQQQLLNAIYTLQVAAAIPTAKQAVQLQLPPK
jgi:hypothetical protein